MYLKALEIQGFKSFPDKIVLPFQESITAVVGPNGSGKSNVSDAIRWVLGEQSSKNLRGGKMEDVIFGGTEKRKQTGYAQVSLVIDNARGIFPLEETEVMVTRKFYRSGESEYFINKHAVRLKDVHELFRGTGLGKEGYAIIGQGKIDEILSVKSNQRREVFEEAAGIAKFRHQKEESERRLSRAEENLLRIEDKLSVLEQQVKPLEQQSATAQKFLILRDELRVLEVSLWLEQLNGVRTGKIKLHTDHALAQQERDHSRQAVDDLYTAVEALAEEIHQKDQEGDGLRETLSQQETKVAEQEGQIAVLENDIRNNQSNEKRLAESLEQKLQRQEELERQLQEQRAKGADLASQKEQLAQSLEAQQGNTKALQENLQALTEKIGSLRLEENAQMEGLNLAKSKLWSLTSSTQEMFDQDAILRQEIAELEEKIQQEEEAIVQQESQEKTLEEGRNTAQNAVDGYTMKVEGREQKCNALQEEKEQRSRGLHAMESKAKLLRDMEQMYEGFSFEVKKVMKEAKQGGLRNIHGPVAELLTVPGDFTVAIETALGGSMQHIVVGDSQDGKAVFQFLQRQKGRATVLPLATMKARYLPQKEAVSKEPGFVGMGCDLVGYDGQYTGIVGNLLGRVVVMENLDYAMATAKKFQYQLRIVTLDGQVQNVGSSMTGGYAPKNAGIFSRKDELEKLQQSILEEVQALKELEENRAQLSNSLSRDRYQLDIAQGELRQFQDQLLQARAQSQGLSRGRDALVAQKGQGQIKLSQLKQRGDQVEGEMEQAKQALQTLEQALHQVQEDYSNSVAQQGQLQSQWQEASEETGQLTAQLERLEAEETAVLALVENVQAHLAEVSDDRAGSHSLMADYQAENQKIHQEIQAKEEEIQESRANCQRLRDAITQANQEKFALESLRNQKDKESREKNNHLLQLERTVTSLGEKKAAAELEETQVLEKFWESYELTHEGALLIQVELESTAKANRRVGELKREITALGNINIDAIEEFRKINESYTYLKDQKDDVVGAKKELEGIIAGIMAEMEEIFLREFARINQAFGEVFARLFGGGRAEAVLEDDGDVLGSGIEIKAQPPGTALKVISLLSGGEKAFIAIALYFAILQIRPAPFVVMDEIDAALDDSNIERFVHYLRNMSENTQFITITHRRGTMEAADVLYGITMQEKGVSRMLRLNLNEVEKTLNMNI